MRRDFAKKNLTAKKAFSAKNAGWRWALFVSAFILFLCTAGFFASHFKKQSARPSALSSRVAHFATWFSERRQHLQKGFNGGLVKVKEFSAQKTDEDPQIHFEFYTALPSMQVGEGAADDIKVSLHHKSEKASNKQAAEPTTIVSAQELEREFASEIKADSYFIQLGIFQSKTAAERYRETLIAAGFAASVVKKSVADKGVYRVQLGPFTKKSEATLAQRQLQRKGLNGLLRKVAEV